MVEATGLFLYRPVAWCFLRGMKYLSILMVGFALLVGGCGQSEADKLRKEIKELKEKQKVRDLKQELADLKKGPSVNLDQIEFKHDTIYFRGEEEPFTGTLIEFHVDGSKFRETSYKNGKRHGTEIVYRKDGSKSHENPWVNGERHGTSISYRQDGSVSLLTPYLEGKEHGREVYYNRDGSLLTEEYKDGEPINGTKNGTEVWSNKDGSKWQEVIWRNGKEISHKNF